MFKVSVFLFFIGMASQLNAGLTAEQVLGEYWKDPNFGVAATDKTVKIELLTGRVLPETMTVPTNTNIRFIFSNISPETHMIAITKDVDALLSDTKFIKFVNDELKHTQQVAVPTQGHSHSHSASSSNESEAIVRTLEQHPTVFVKSHEEKEILIRFKEENQLTFFCALDDHRLTGFIGKINVVDQDK